MSGARLYVLVLSSVVIISLPTLADQHENSCTLVKAGILPVTLTAHDQLVVSGSVDGQPTQFGIATGSSTTIMDSVGKAEREPGGASEKSDNRPYFADLPLRKKKIAKLTIGEYSMDNATYLFSEKPFLPKGIYGEIGYDLFQFFDIEFDLSNNKIVLYKPNNCGERLAYWSNRFDEDDVVIRGGQIVSDVEINGIRARAVIDSGHSFSSISWDLARRIGISLNSKSILSAVSEFRRIPPYPSVKNRFDQIKIGDEIIKDSVLRVEEYPRMFWVYTRYDVTDVDMILGVDFINSHHIYIDSEKHKMYFTWNGKRIFSSDTLP